MDCIDVLDLSIGYDNVEIIHKLNFSIEEKDYLCIVGENGSGKSTLMKTLLGIQKPLSGEIKFVEGLNKKNIGYLPQQTIVQRDFPASVWEVVLSGRQGKKKFVSFYNDVDKEIAKKCISRLGLNGFEKRCYRELSGGQQQRVLLARALCASEKILLLDEPIVGLDQNIMQDMYNIIKELNNDGITIIMITHDLLCSLKYCNKVLYIGSQIFYGTTQEFLNSSVAKTFSVLEGDK